MQQPNRFRLSLAFAPACTLVLILLALFSGMRQTPADAATRARVSEIYGKLPLSFEANRGQAAAPIRFLARNGNYTLALSPNEAALALPAGSVRLRLLNAQPAPQMEGLAELPGKINYLSGNDPRAWRTNVPTFAKVRYAAVYPGIDLLFYGNRQELEYDFVVAPGADPRLIQVEFSGARVVRLDKNGELVLDTAAGEIRQRKPVIYQTVHGARRVIAGGYIKTGRNRFGFRVAKYDRQWPLVIDPVLVYAKPLNVNGGGSGSGVALDASGNAYITGSANPLSPTTELQAQVFRSGDAAGSWEQAGTLEAYAARVLAVDPQNPAVAYAAGTAGVFKSVDSGRTWSSAGNFNANLVYVQVLALDPVNPQTIYAGGSVGLLPGIYKSTNGGATWERTAFDVRTQFLKTLLIDPAAPATLYAQLDYGAIYKSTDGGGSWQVSATGFPNPPGVGLAITALALDPRAPATLYAADVRGTIYKSTNSGANWAAAGEGLLNTGVTQLAAEGGTLYAVTLAGIFKSVNGGVNWTASDAGIVGDRLDAFVIDRRNPAVLYALAGSAGENSTLYKSADGGANWRPANAGIERRGVGAVALAPSDSRTIYATTYAGTGGEAFVAKLNPAGTALVYTSFFGGSRSDTAYSVAVDAAGSAYVAGFTYSEDFPLVNALYDGQRSTFFKTVNGAASWQASGALRAINALAFDPANAATLYAATGNGFFKSTDSGANWRESGYGLPTREVSALLVDPRTPTTLYAAAKGRNGGGTVYQSTDGGANWSSSGAGLSGSPVFALVFDPANSSTLYAGTGGGVFKSTNGGGNWLPMNNGLTYPVLPPATGTETVIVFGLALSPPATIYAATNRGAFRSTNGGASWEAINNGLLPQSPNQQAARAILVVAVDPRTPTTLYALGHESVYKSTDGGANWRIIRQSGGNQLLLDPASPQTLYLSSPLARSTDGGATWSPANAGLLNGYVRALALDPRNPATLYAATDNPNHIGYTRGGFLAKLNPAGTGLVYSTYLDALAARSVAVDGAGNAYVTGDTAGNLFPVTAGTFQPQYRGTVDAFVAKINAAGSAFVFATYLGGAGDDRGFALAVDALSNVYVTGGTTSGNSNPAPDPNAFPTTPGAAYPRGASSFLTKLNATGTTAIYSTFINPQGRIAASALAVDANGNAYVAGQADEYLVTTPGAFQRANAGTATLPFDAFVSKFSPGGALVYATYLGGSSNETGAGLAVDAAGQAYVTGGTGSTNFPVTADAAQISPAGGMCPMSGYPQPMLCSDSFLSQLNVAGTGLVYSTYYGSSGLHDSAAAAALDAAGNVVIAGTVDGGRFVFLGQNAFAVKYGPGGAALRVASVSAASFRGPDLAAESISAAFGFNLATRTAAANGTPLPTELQGTTVRVRDSAGVERLAPLFFVSAAQVNFQVPAGTANGAAEITITSGANVLSNGTAPIATVAPGLFAAAGNGRGLAAALVLRIKPGNVSVFEPVARFDQAANRWVAVPIDLGPENEQVFLVLFGTGLRRRSAETAVSVKFGDIEGLVSFAGAQPNLVGVDQINVRLPRTLAGRGELDVAVTVDGKAANAVRVSFK